MNEEEKEVLKRRFKQLLERMKDETNERYLEDLTEMLEIVIFWKGSTKELFE